MSVTSIVPPDVSLVDCIMETSERVVELSVRDDLKLIKEVTPAMALEAKLQVRPQLFGSNSILKQKKWNSQETLQEMNHDPLEELVKLHTRLERTLQVMEEVRDGIRIGKFSNEYYCQTLALLQKNNNDLLRYGYARVSETLKVEQTNAPVLSIKLTTPESFNRDDNAIEHEHKQLK